MASSAGVNSWLLKAPVKPVLGFLALLPLVWLIYAAFNNLLGANPAQYLVRATGDWAIRALCLVLAVTPLRVMTGWSALARLRRMLGLFVYFYVVLHLLSYSWFDMSFEWDDIVRDIPKRPFILVGFSAFVLLTPLTATSFNRAIKTLGVRRWQALHKSVYVVAGLAILHFFWMRAAKNDFGEVVLYAVILGVLLGWRLRNFLNKRALENRKSAPYPAP
jgi:methionine sulfoxide reductase heme-binding subunit